MHPLATVLSAALVFSASGSAYSQTLPLAEFIPSGSGAFQIDAGAIISVEIGEALGTSALKTLSIKVEPAEANKWYELTRRNVLGTLTVKICGRIVTENVQIQTEMRGPIFVPISTEDVDWATAALIGRAGCELSS